VQPGDTVSEIAEAYGVSTEALIQANNLRSAHLIYPGQKLIIPGAKRYTVSPGDTVYSIARRHGATVGDIVTMNRLSDPYTIHVGETLLVPPVASRTASRSSSSRSSSSTSRSSSSSSKSASSSSGSSSSRAAAKPPSAKPPSGGFEWPVSGKVISSYGPKENGLHNDGVNIAAPEGTPVRAAQSGVVVYAGNELKGYGNLLIVRHSGGWMTAYAHNSKLLVSRGAEVKKGQAIAAVGSSGNVTSPQLHFEIRRGKNAVNPAPLLGSPPATASG